MVLPVSILNSLGLPKFQLTDTKYLKKLLLDHLKFETEYNCLGPFTRESQAHLRCVVESGTLNFTNTSFKDKDADAQ